ncbi:hypothetical protein [Pseudoroseomonas cervicalis]|uniref:hypothetical protein n=1 Tax=Teichococcus cervicalis TaxID=204525 RepID=UPI0027D774B0|nr:hypothetical protein [Pseudoroseomonas cervicalis]
MQLQQQMRDAAHGIAPAEAGQTLPQPGAVAHQPIGIGHGQARIAAHELAEPVLGEDAEAGIGQRRDLGPVLAALDQVAGQVEVEDLAAPIRRRRPGEGPAGIEGEDGVTDGVARAHQAHGGADARDLPHPRLRHDAEQGEGAHGAGRAGARQGRETGFGRHDQKVIGQGERSTKSLQPFHFPAPVSSTAA